MSVQLQYYLCMDSAFPIHSKIKLDRLQLRAAAQSELQAFTQVDQLLCVQNLFAKPALRANETAGISRTTDFPIDPELTAAAPHEAWNCCARTPVDCNETLARDLFPR